MAKQPQANAPVVEDVKDVVSEKQPEEPRLVPTHEVQNVWNSSDPNMKAQELFTEFLRTESGKRDQDLNKWDDCENRFEPAEMRWIANYIVDSLCFAIDKLKLDDSGVS